MMIWTTRKTIIRLPTSGMKGATLLGYKTHAHYVIEERMAKPRQVYQFLNEIVWKRAKPAAERGYTQLEILPKIT